MSSPRPRRSTGLPPARPAPFSYGNPGDTAFTAQLDYTFDLNGRPATLYGDGLGVRRNEVSALPFRSARCRPALRCGDTRCGSTRGGRLDHRRHGVGRRQSRHTGSDLMAERGDRRPVGARGRLGPARHGHRGHAGERRPHPANVLVLLGGTNDLARRIPWAPRRRTCRPGRDGWRPRHLARRHTAERCRAGRANLQCPPRYARHSGALAVPRPVDLSRREGRLGSRNHRRGIHPTPQTAAAIGQAISGSLAGTAAAHRPLFSPPPSADHS